VTIDGKTWNVKNSANAASMDLDDGVHSGLYMKCSTANSTTNTPPTISAPILYTPLVNLNAALVPGSWQELRIWYMLTCPHVPNANSEVAEFHYVDWDGATSFLTTAGGNYFSEAYGYATALGTYNGLAVSMYGGAAATNGGSTSTNPSTYDVMCLVVTEALVKLYLGQSSGGNFPALSAMTMRGFLSGRWGAASSTKVVPTTAISIQSGNTAGNADVLVSKMKVEYR